MLYYRVKRFRTGGGVTHPSQRRYVHYFMQALHHPIHAPVPICLEKIVFNTAPHIKKNGCSPWFEIYNVNSGEIIMSTAASCKKQRLKIQDCWDDQMLHEFRIDCNFLDSDDILIEVLHQGKFKKKKLFRFSFNTAMLDERETITYDKSQLDPDVTVHDPHYSPNFSVNLHFRPLCMCNPYTPLL